MQCHPCWQVDLRYSVLVVVLGHSLNCRNACMWYKQECHSWIVGSFWTSGINKKYSSSSLVPFSRFLPASFPPRIRAGISRIPVDSGNSAGMCNIPVFPATCGDGRNRKPSGRVSQEFYGNLTKTKSKQNLFAGKPLWCSKTPMCVSSITTHTGLSCTLLP